MTLLEATIAFVLLSIVGIVCLDQSRAASRLERASVEWTDAVARGESAMQSAIADRPLADTNVDARDVQVSRLPWRGRVDVVEVTVPLAHGGTYTTRRLVERATDRTVGLVR